MASSKSQNQSPLYRAEVVIICVIIPGNECKELENQVPQAGWRKQISRAFNSWSAELGNLNSYCASLSLSLLLSYFYLSSLF